MIDEFFTLAPKLAQYWPRIEKAIATIERIAKDPATTAAISEVQKLMKDPDVADLLALAKELSAIIKQPTPTVHAPDLGIAGQ